MRCNPRLCAGALLLCATWFTVALISNEDPAHRAITVVNSGSSGKVLLASVSVAVIGCLILALVGVVFPLLIGTHTVGISDLIVGIEAELICAATGISIGLLCSRLVFRRPGYALIVATALVMTVLLVPGLPPVNMLFRLMANATSSADLIPPVTGLLAIAVIVLAASSLATHAINTRKD